MSRVLMVFLAVAMGVAARGQDEKLLTPDFKVAIAHQHTKCHVGSISFDLRLGDDEKIVDEEAKEFGYSYFWIQPDDAAPFAAIAAKQYNEMLFLKPEGPSLCQDTLALAGTNGAIAIFVRQNNRPFDDRLGVSFYDPAQRKVLASCRDVGAGSGIEKVGDGFAFKVHDGPTDLLTFDVTVEGKTSRTEEEVFDFWKSIRRNDSKIIHDVDRDLTWSKSAYRRYFKSQKEFEEAFAWNDEKKVYSAVWVYRVKNPDCIQPSIHRKANSKSKWFCAK